MKRFDFYINGEYLKSYSKNENGRIEAAAYYQEMKYINNYNLTVIGLFDDITSYYFTTV